MKQLFLVRTICVRCGNTKKELRADPVRCAAYGTSYPHHIYNDAPLTLEVHHLTLP
jgi:hypothetical protein